MIAQLRAAIGFLLLFTLLTGILYPLAVTAVAQAVFPEQANGSLLIRDGKVVGSSLIGQPFDDPKYFWSRPSATSPVPYNAGASSGSNLGPTNPALVGLVKARAQALRIADPGNDRPIPVDLTTASGSGLDPHVSPAAAEYQAKRVAKARNMKIEEVTALIEKHAQGRTLEVLGEPRVNVVELNLALDAKDQR